MELWQAASVLIAAMFGFSYVTNPFSRFSIVQRNYRAELTSRTIDFIDENHKLKVNNHWIVRGLAILNSGIYILSSRWHKRPTSQAKTIKGIINDIYQLRFDPSKLLLTSGDHFSSLFVRNLGVFYYPTLDNHTPVNTDKWQRRQICYLQTLAYALGVFSKCDHLTTTIVPTGRNRATCVDFHAYPSDTMYGMLYALAALLGKQPPRPFDYSTSHTSLDTISAAEALLKKYSPILVKHYHKYRDTAFDEETDLAKRHFHMSGAKDITKRDCAFYDNVIFWKTTQLAMKLGLIVSDQAFLAELKQRIIERFWLEDKGYFLEDLADESIHNSYYSSDWLIVLATGFLSPQIPSERHFFERSVSYIQRKKIDQPFAIKYQSDTRAHRQFAIVRFAVASYGGDSIWSFWGMEYIKTLLALYSETNEKKYLQSANYHIDKYREKMLQYGGYPEVYDKNGSLLETPFYRSIIQTGWVVGFEQVVAIRDSLKK